MLPQNPLIARREIVQLNEHHCRHQRVVEGIVLKRLLHQATLGDQSYRFMFDRGPEGEYVAIDCETTGLNVRKDDIVTIAAIKICRNRIMTSERFEAVVRPDAC